MTLFENLDFWLKTIRVVSVDGPFVTLRIPCCFGNFIDLMHVDNSWGTYAGVNLNNGFKFTHGGIEVHFFDQALCVLDVGSAQAFDFFDLERAVFVVKAFGFVPGGCC